MATFAFVSLSASADLSTVIMPGMVARYAALVAAGGATVRVAYDDARRYQAFLVQVQDGADWATDSTWWVEGYAGLYSQAPEDRAPLFQAGWSDLDMVEVALPTAA